ncbi:hypothetical protein GMDG_02766 [Pseudogymnoascus destructans 20631-21]|uniref:Uncharacterized protein n=1 Tax=Pseudogymnoascus destructans (strain ATCC MYA-4855 / 20631-21) TaxID=658429 RepID=L8G4X9_PSED2|nr:hypothetical protein GMDG_02766 [Pseudogymnoascus destructans 20631-21]
MDLSNFLNPAEEGIQEVSDAQDDDDEEPQHRYIHHGISFGHPLNKLLRKSPP